MTTLVGLPLKVLFLVNGLGSGNAARIDAIARVFEDRGWQVEIAAAGNGFLYFSRQRPSLRTTELRQTRYRSSQHRFSVASLFLSAVLFVANGCVNFFRIKSTLSRFQPSLIVHDSIYNAAILFSGSIAVVSVNNSIQICRESQRWPLPKSVRSQFFVERLDAFFQRCFPALVLCPWFAAAGSHDKKTKLIEPVVRRQFNVANELDLSCDAQRIAVIYSGSGLGANLHRDLATHGLQVTVLGYQGKDRNEQIEFIDGALDISEILRNCDLVVMMAGFSSLAEAIAMKIPMVIVPLDGQSEQFINAKAVEALGLGLVAAPESVASTVQRALTQLSSFKNAFDSLNFQTRGADQAYDAIVNFLKTEART